MESRFLTGAPMRAGIVMAAFAAALIAAVPASAAEARGTPQPESLLPTYLRTFSPGYLLLELAFVVLVSAGLINAWSSVRDRVLRGERSFWVVAAEAMIAGPWVLFPPLFLLSLAGAFRPAVLSAQGGLLLLGLWTLVARRRAIGRALRALPETFRAEPLLAPAGVAVALFVLWGWLMPFPESFNGHHHDVVNQLQHTWSANRFDVLPRTNISYDNSILVWPAPFAYSLSLFSLPLIAPVGLRPIFLLPGLFALLTLNLFRVTGGLLARRKLGSIAFICVAFSYWTSSNFTELDFDLYTPLVLAFFGYHVVRRTFRGESAWFPLLLLLSVTLTVRKQLFLLLGILVLGLLAARLVSLPSPRGLVRKLRSSALPLVIAVVLPAALWSSFTWFHYGSPFYPHDTPATCKVFDVPTQFENWRCRISESSTTHRARTLWKLHDVYLPVSSDRGAASLLKSLLSGLTVTVAFVGLLVFLVLGWWFRFRALLADSRRLWALAAVYVAGFLVTDFLFLPPKLENYLPLLTALFPAVVLIEGAIRGLGALLVSAFVLVIFAVGMGSWALNGWGHSSQDTSLTNVKFLWPYYGTPLERLARRTNRPRQVLEVEMREYVHALADLEHGEQILFMEHEPGALVPGLLDRQYLGDVLYVSNLRARPLTTARTIAQLRTAMRKMRIAFVYVPQRPHAGLENTLLFSLLRTYRGPEAFVVPADRLLRG